MTIFDRRGNDLLIRNRVSAEYRSASPRAQSLSAFTGFVAKDIDTISHFCSSKQLLLVSRCPDFNANGHMPEVKSGEFHMKPSHIKKKTEADGILKWGGRNYVSDYDLMCVHRVRYPEGQYEAMKISWDGSSKMNLDENAVIGYLNQFLIYPFQHGCNDCYVIESADGKIKEPKNKYIGDEFLVFRNQDVWPVFSRFDLKTKVYDRYGLTGWHQAYGF